MLSDRQRGMVLLFVLWLVVALAALALPFVQTSGETARLQRAAIETLHLDAAAEAALWLAAEALLVGRLRPGGELVEEFAGTTIHLAVSGESGRVDLSAATAEVLDLWLEAHGIEGSERAALRDRILDWRDGDSLRRVAGAEADDYRRLHRPGPADRGFLHPFELAAIPGFARPQLSAMLADATVFTGYGEPVAELAPATLRARLEGRLPAALQDREGRGIAVRTGSEKGTRIADPADTYRLAIRVERAGLAKRVIAVVTIPPDFPPSPLLLDWIAVVESAGASL